MKLGIIELRSVYRCSIPGCGVVEEKTETGWPLAQAYFYSMPDGWHICPTGLVCTKHKVEVRIDGGMQWTEVDGPRP